MTETREVTAIVEYTVGDMLSPKSNGVKEITLPISKKLKISEPLKTIHQEIISRLKYEHPNINISIDSLKIEENKQG